MNDETRINIRNRWVKLIFELAHSEFQNRLWIEADYEDLVGDYNECVCGYFDDLDLENGYTNFIVNRIISEFEYNIVKELHSEFKKYTERIEKQNLSDKNILKDVEWINITNIGINTWTELKRKTQSNLDKKLMAELENKYLK
ncbi:hypothetical protein [Patiriisocius hiemis]|uniref:Uncharacterized protein n=1 Tax=Patiriisocius hiemis TaxID=3075604 RepID=A0ABU2YDA3_9FLAO|nr:hypothetical protein [Constantimarinum sp. W242]MDT0556146.1 hypothetical protein [Constantimarinum sp. W242]